MSYKEREAKRRDRKIAEYFRNQDFYAGRPQSDVKSVLSDVKSVLSEKLGDSIDIDSVKFSKEHPETILANLIVPLKSINVTVSLPSDATPTHKPE